MRIRAVTSPASCPTTRRAPWAELLKEIAPRTVRIALLFNPATAVQYVLPSIQDAARHFAVQVTAAPVHAKDEIHGVIAAQSRDPGGILIDVQYLLHESTSVL